MINRDLTYLLDNSSNSHMHTYKYNRHQERVLSIQDQIRKPRDFRNDFKSLNQKQDYLKNLTRIRPNFLETLRKDEIKINNQHLLNRLLEITQGKQGEFCKPKLIDHEKFHSQILKEHSNLTAPHQKQQFNQIQEQNQRIAFRILDQKPFVDKKQMKKQVQEYLSLKKNLSKRSRLPSIYNKNLEQIIQRQKKRSISPTTEKQKLDDSMQEDKKIRNRNQTVQNETKKSQQKTLSIRTLDQTVLNETKKSQQKTLSIKTSDIN